MSDNDRTGDRPAGRPKVKVTDRRRVREEGAAAAPSEAPGSGDRRSTPEAELAAARKEAAEYRDHLMRLQAEFDFRCSPVEILPSVLGGRAKHVPHPALAKNREAR